MDALSDCAVPHNKRRLPHFYRDDPLPYSELSFITLRKCPLILFFLSEILAVTQAEEVAMSANGSTLIISPVFAVLSDWFFLIPLALIHVRMVECFI